MLYYKHPATGQTFGYQTEEERQRWGAPELEPLLGAALDAFLNPPEKIVAIRNALIQEARDMREKIVTRLNGISGRKDRANKTSVAIACDAAVESLLDITANLPADPAAIPGEVFNRYGVIRAALATAVGPAEFFEIDKAFTGLDS